MGWCNPLSYICLKHGSVIAKYKVSSWDEFSRCGYRVIKAYRRTKLPDGDTVLWSERLK